MGLQTIKGSVVTCDRAREKEIGDHQRTPLQSGRRCCPPLVSGDSKRSIVGSQMNLTCALYSGAAGGATLCNSLPDCRLSNLALESLLLGWVD